MRHWGFCTWGIQTGPFAAGKADFVSTNFQLLDLYTAKPVKMILFKKNTFLPFILGAPISYYCRERKEGRKLGRLKWFYLDSTKKRSPPGMWFSSQQVGMTVDIGARLSFLRWQIWRILRCCWVDPFSHWLSDSITDWTPALSFLHWINLPLPVIDYSSIASKGRR